MKRLSATERDRACILIGQGEDWLMNRVLSYAKTHGYTAYTSTLIEPWRESIQGLSAPLMDFFRWSGPPELSATTTFDDDPAAAFGIREAEKHRARGITLGLFLGLMKYYRACYLDLLAQSDHFGGGALPRVEHVVNCFFDRVEIGFCEAWNDFGKDARLVELQQANRRLSNEKNLYLTCFESLDEAVVLIGPEDRILNVNLTASRLFFGRSQSGAFYYDHDHPEDWRNDALDALAVAPDDLDGEEWLDTAYGRKLFRVLKRPMLDVSDKFTGSVLVLRDITAERRMDEALRDARRSLDVHLDERTRTLRATIERLRQSNADLERFAYIASHDLQEPLRMVASYTQLLARRYGEHLDEDGRTYVDFAVSGARRMHALIEDLLSYSRVTTRGADPAPCDAGTCLGNAMMALAATLSPETARIAVDQMPVVQADGVQLSQLFQNLISNAVKFRRQDGPAKIEISAVADGDYWHFSVRDHGIGIPEADREKAFAIFQRLPGREAYPGTGIGLAVCKRIVERHGGRITLSDTPGGGTTVSFDLPGEAAPFPIPASASGSAPAPGSLVS